MALNIWWEMISYLCRCLFRELYSKAESLTKEVMERKRGV